MAGIQLELSAYVKPPLILRGIAESKEYKDGAATGKVDGYKLDMVSLGSNFETFSVKVQDLHDSLKNLDNSEIEAGNNNKRYTLINFINATCSPYAAQGGGVRFSCKAESANIISPVKNAESAKPQT
jgi:hypothetical protein